MANAFDEFVPKAPNAFDEYSPATTESTPPQTATEVLTAPKSLWERLNSPTQPEKIDFNDIGASGLLGTGIGALEGSATGMGTVPGAIIGGVTGLTSGATGEISRAMGATPLNQFISEMVGGGAPIALYKAAKTGINPLVSMAKGKAIAGVIPEVELEQRAKQQVLNKLFGSDVLNKSFDRDLSLQAQDELAQKYLGTSASQAVGNSGKKVSDIIREDLYNNIDKMQQQSNTTTTKFFDMFGLPKGKETKTTLNVFYDSPEYKSLMNDIGDLKTRGTAFASESQVKEMLKTLKLPYENPNVAKFAKSDLLGLIQNRGSYRNSTTGDTSEVISIPMQEALRSRFNEYLKRNLGEEQYNVLKSVERQEFEAQGRDAIKNLVSTNWKLGSDEFKTLISHIGNSPAGKKDLITAAIQEISKQPNEKMMLARLGQLRQSLVESGAIGKDDMRGIYSQLKTVKDEINNSISYKGIDPKVKDQKKMNMYKNAIIFPMSSALSAEIGNYGGSAIRNEPTRQSLQAFTF
jgi:hypothetical protein